MAERIYRTLEACERPVCVLTKGGRRWETDGRATRERERHDGRAATARPGAGWSRLAVAAWVGDPLTPELLHAAAMGWPILMFAPHTATLARALGGVLNAGEHVTIFSSANGLREALRGVRAHDTMIVRRAAAARAHVLEKHTWKHRLQALGAALAARTSVAPRS